MTVRNEGRLDIVSKDGQTFFLPVKENKINNVRCWEQAFRVYAVIYSSANPKRSAEIWQYVFTINSAASSFHWENVAYYDFTFRQLMAYNPERSWAKIYTQMWNLAMRDPINQAGGISSFSSTSGGFNTRNDKQSGNKRKNKYCWKFNKSTCNEGRNCNFPHRCYYCNAFNHGISSCRKREKKEQHRKESSGQNTEKRN